MAKKRQIIKDVLVLLYFTVSTLIISYPLIFHLHDYIFGIGDELLITWIMNWEIYAVTHTPLSLFNANIFYPYPNTLAYSDAFLTSTLLSMLPVLLTGYPLLAFNITYLIAHISLGFFTYLLLHYLSKSRYAAMVGGTLATFTTYTVNKYVHLQMLSVQWIPLSILFFFIYIKKKKFRYIILSALCFVFQTWNSFLPGYFLLAFYAVAMCHFFFKNKTVLRLFINRKILFLAIVAILAVGWVALPYFQVSQQFNYVRDIRDTIRFANRQEYILYPNDRTRLANILIQTFYSNDKNPIKHDGYIGASILFLGLTAVVYRLRKGKKALGPYFDIFFLTACMSYVLSLGSALQWFGRVVKIPFIIPLPYAILYYVLPGFKGFRNSARWEMLYVICLSVMIGLFLAMVFKNKSKLYKIIVSILICVIVILEINFPFHYVKLPTPEKFPAVYSSIQSLPKNSVIVEMPIYNWSMLPYAFQENVRMYYSTLHHKRMVNGTSGFSPPEWQKHVVEIHNNFPNVSTIAYFKRIGVTHIVIHAEEYNMLYKESAFGNKSIYNWGAIKKDLDKEPSLQFVKRVDNDYIYTILYD